MASHSDPFVNEWMRKAKADAARVVRVKRKETIAVAASLAVLLAAAGLMFGLAGVLFLLWVYASFGLVSGLLGLVCRWVNS